jgi:membrane associated rhomboid family serine protease
MDRSPLAAFPRPGKAPRAVLITIAVFGLLGALLYHWIPGGQTVWSYVVVQPGALLHGEWWRAYSIVTAALMTSPTSVWHLVFTLMGLYFLSTDLERRWGAWRFVRFLVTSVVLGTGIVLLFRVLTPATAAFFQQPPILFGPMAALTGTAVAWGRENPNIQVRLFFFLPMSGKWLLWATLGLSFLQLLYQEPIYEGRLAPFGGIIAGLLLSGSPSAVRRLYLQAKLWVLRKRGAPRVEIEVAPRGAKKRSGPPLRVVMGGLDESIEKRTPPKDKRYLN